MSYSQNDEEEVILDLFKNQPVGRLLDIGAFDGKTFSNSLALLEHGWSGVLVEPNPTSLCSLVKLHGQNPRVKIIGALVTPENVALKQMFTCDDAVSTTNADFKPMWEQIGVKFQPVWFPPLHPLQLIGEPYDFITVDVEDGTLPLVESLMAAFSKCKVACVEHSVGTNVIKRELRHVFEELLQFKLVHTTGENFIFAK